MIVTSKTIWFDGQNGPKIFSTDHGRIQMHEFALIEQENFLKKIEENFKNKDGQDTQGIYILLGEVEETEMGPKQKAYIGEGNMMSRLYDHKNNEEKSFAKRVVLISSKDITASFTKGDLQFIEKELIRKFILSGYEVQNRNSGQGQLVNQIQKLKLQEEVDTISMGFESMGISLKDATTYVSQNSTFINKEDKLEEIEIYTKIPNSDQIIYGRRNIDGSYTIYKDQTIKHKARKNQWGQAQIKKSLKAAEIDNRLKVEGTVDGYTVYFVEDVTYKTWSPSLYFVQGGIAANNSWKNAKTKQSLAKK